MTNPFEDFDLDPRDGVHAITERLRELAEDAPDEAARARVRSAWEELTLHPARRVRAALLAHPETRPPLGAPPPPPARIAEPPLTVADVAPRPSVARALASATPAAVEIARATPPPPLPLDEDPVLQGLGQ
jgi:hypothetical protein